MQKRPLRPRRLQLPWPRWHRWTRLSSSSRSGSQCSHRRWASIPSPTASTAPHGAPPRLAVACLGRTVRSRAQPRAAPALGPQIPTSVPDTKDQYKTDSVEKGADESWISGEFWALCAQDLKEISWPKRAQV